MSKVKLERDKSLNNPFYAERTKSISYMLPFYKSSLTTAKYVHRVRSANSHWHNGKLSHISIHFWCGNIGYIDGRGRLYAEVQNGEILCATCEGRAIGSGQDGARIINGREVMYSPKPINNEA